MKNIIKKIGGLCLGLAMLSGVAVGISSTKASEVKAEDVTFTFESTSALQGWTSNPAPSSCETASPSRGLAWSKTAITSFSYVCSDYGVTKVTVVASANNAGYTLSVNGGTAQSITKSNNATYTFNVSVSKGGTIALSTTKNTDVKSFWIKSITLTKTASEPTKGTLAIKPVDNDAVIVNTVGNFEYTLTGGSQSELTFLLWESSDSSTLEFTNTSTGEYSAKKTGNITIYLSGSDADSFTYDKVSYLITVKLPEPGSKENPFNVETALVNSGKTNVYTTGIVSKIDEISTAYGNATYYISDTGEETNELEIYRGNYLNNTSFTSQDQLQIGDKVTVFGNITTHTGVVEYAQGNYITSIKSEPRLLLSQDTIEVTNGLTGTVTATPSNFDDGTISYSNDTDSCATLSYSGNTITITANNIGLHKFTITGFVAGVEQASAELTVNVVSPYPTNISRSGYASFTDSQKFIDGTGSITITYSDSQTKVMHLGDSGVQLFIGSEEIDVNSSTKPYVGANNNTKIQYTENGRTVSTSNYTLNVTAEMEITSFEDVPEYLIIDAADPKHSATVYVNYKSIIGEPELSITSSNPSKLIVTYDPIDNIFEDNIGLASFTIEAGTTQGQFSVIASITLNGRTESKSFSINVRGEEPAPSSGTYKLVTSLADLENGNYVFAAKVGDNYIGMTKTIISNKVESTALTVVNDEIDSTTGDTISYYLSVTGTHSTRSISIKYDNSYFLYQSGSNTDIKKQTTEYFWTVSAGSNGSFRFASTTAGRGLHFRASTYELFAGYSSSNAKAGSTEYFDIELFKYVEQKGDSFDLINDFVSNYMHMNDISIDDRTDTGACKGSSGLYLTAKVAWHNMDESYTGEDNLVEVFENSFEDAYARYMAWATACGDTDPFNGTTIVSAPSTLINSMDSLSATWIIVAVSLAGLTAIGGYFFYKKRKENF